MISSYVIYSCDDVMCKAVVKLYALIDFLQITLVDMLKLWDEEIKLFDIL